MKVLSLFDGISCGMVALERDGIKVDRYVSYEIDKFAIKVSQKNYPQIEQCGDVTTADFSRYKGFDLLIGGSPCQDLSKLGSRKGLRGQKSQLFYEYIRALKEIKPKYFLFENTALMSKENVEIITKLLGVKPVLINSADFSAQNRRRYYWTNITVEKWEKKNIYINDVLSFNRVYRKADDVKTIKEAIPKLIKKYGRVPKIFNAYNVTKIENKAPALTCGSMMTSSCATLIYKKVDNIDYVSALTVDECCKLQTLPTGYCDNVSNSVAYSLIGNGWTVDVIAHILTGIKENNNEQRTRN